MVNSPAARSGSVFQCRFSRTTYGGAVFIRLTDDYGIQVETLAG